MKAKVIGSPPGWMEFLTLALVLAYLPVQPRPLLAFIEYISEMRHLETCLKVVHVYGYDF